MARFELSGAKGKMALCGFGCLAMAGVASLALDHDGGVIDFFQAEESRQKSAAIALIEDQPALAATSVSQSAESKSGVARGTAKSGSSPQSRDQAGDRPEGEPESEPGSSGQRDRSAGRSSAGVRGGLPRGASAGGSRPGSSGGAIRQGLSLESPEIAVALSDPIRVAEGESEEDEEAEEDEDDEDEKDEQELGPTIATPILGKVMSRQSRAGIPGVTVTALIFHAISPIAGAPLWVTLGSAQTDDRGLFSASFEMPQSPPPGASLGLILSAEGHQSLGGVPVSSVVPGQASNIGVFWLRPETHLVTTQISPSTLGEGARVVDTGGLNPLAWDARLLGNLLDLFPAHPIDPSSPGESLNLWAWQEPDLRGQRWATLRSSAGALLATRPVAFSVVKVPDGATTKDVVQGRLEFTLGEDTSFSGSIELANGGVLQGAVVKTIATSAEPQQTAISNARGQFRFAAPPRTLAELEVSHPEYLTKRQAIDRRATHTIVVLDQRRPEFTLQLESELDRSPIVRPRLTLLGVASGSSPPPTRRETPTNEQGEFTISSEWAIASITIEADGFFSKLLAAPSSSDTGPQSVLLTPSRVITATARDAASRSDRWSDFEASSLVTYWSSTWLEFEIDYGPELAAFDFELVLRNHGIIDNQYHFDVRVDLDGAQVGRLAILASQGTQRQGRLALPPGRGLRRIRITWLNDRWIKDQLDANIIVDEARFFQRALTEAERIADSAR